MHLVYQRGSCGQVLISQRGRLAGSLTLPCLLCHCPYMHVCAHPPEAAKVRAPVRAVAGSLRASAAGSRSRSRRQAWMKPRALPRHLCRRLGQDRAISLACCGSLLLPLSGLHLRSSSCSCPDFSGVTRERQRPQSNSTLNPILLDLIHFINAIVQNRKLFANRPFDRAPLLPAASLSCSPWPACPGSTQMQRKPAPTPPALPPAPNYQACAPGNTQGGSPSLPEASGVGGQTPCFSLGHGPDHLPPSQQQRLKDHRGCPLSCALAPAPPQPQPPTPLSRSRVTPTWHRSAAPALALAPLLLSLLLTGATAAQTPSSLSGPDSPPHGGGGEVVAAAQQQRTGDQPILTNSATLLRGTAAAPQHGGDKLQRSRSSPDAGPGDENHDYSHKWPPLLTGDGMGPTGSSSSSSSGAGRAEVELLVPEHTARQRRVQQASSDDELAAASSIIGNIIVLAGAFGPLPPMLGPFLPMFGPLPHYLLCPLPPACA